MSTACVRRLLLLLFCLLPLSKASSSQVRPAGPNSELRDRVIVFVHGLHGDKTSWRADNGAYWPDLVRSDPRFAYSDVNVAEYPSPNSNGKMSSVQLAEYLWNNLRQNHVWDHREVVFLAHSLGGFLVEEMLLLHPSQAAQVKFIVSYGTPHEGSTVARVASFYDRDPLLNDLSDAGSNTFLTNLEGTWRSRPAVNGIHRFCAYEGQDTRPDQGFVRYLRPHTRVVGYFSATYGCDVTTPPQEIPADHIGMIKPVNRNAPAYDFFRRVYRDNPVLLDQDTIKENTVGGLTAACGQTKSSDDLQVPINLDSTLHERVTAATALLVNQVDVHDVDPNPPAVTRLDPDGTAHVRYSFKGPGRKLIVCTGTGRAAVEVQFTVHQQVPLREPANH